MDDLNLLKRLERVKAPPDFEQKILAQLSLRKRKKLRVKHLRLSLAGAFGAALVFFIVMNFFILPRKSPVEFADLEKGFFSVFQGGEEMREREAIPIIEAIDYSREIQTVSQELRTIYILEQVFEGTNTKIKY